MYVTSPLNTTQSVTIPFCTDEKGRASEGWVHHVKAGKALFHEGDSSEFIYEVLDGVVRSTKILFDGRRQVLNFGYPGDVVGISHDHIYHNDCDAVTDLKVRIYQKNANSVSHSDDPEFSDILLRTAAAEMNSMQEHFLMLGRKSAMEKMASFLTTLLDRQGEQVEGAICFDLPMTRSDIADFLGLTIETVSRTFTKLRRQTIIDLENAQHVCVLKPSVLRSLAEKDVG